MCIRDRELPTGYVGMIPWKLVVSMPGSNGKASAVRSSEIGYTYVKKTASQNESLKILQIMPNEATYAVDDQYVNLSTNDGRINIQMGDLLNSAANTLGFTVTVDHMFIYHDIDHSQSHHYPGKMLSETLGNNKTDGEKYYNDYLKNYDMIIFGFNDSNDHADPDYTKYPAFYDGLNMYIESGKPVLLSHDLTSWANKRTGAKKSDNYNGLDNTSTPLPYYTTRYLRNIIGMDRYGILYDPDSTSGLSDRLKNQGSDYSSSGTAGKSVINAADSANKDVAYSPDGKI